MLIQRLNLACSETSADTTFLRKSQLMGFLSNREQDYKHARWELAQRYGKFLSQAPTAATQALFPIVEAHGERKHHGSSEVAEFSVSGIKTGIREDHSHIWDSNWFGEENVSAIVHEFFRYLHECLEDSERAKFTAALVNYVVAKARDAVLWRRLLNFAARYPVLARQLRDAAMAEPLLLARDTERPMYLLIEVLHASSSSEEREGIENAIMALGDVDEPRRKWGAHCRDIFLAALRDGAVATEKAQVRIEELRAASALRTTAPIDPVAQARAVAIDPEEFYAMRGISTEGIVNQELVDLLRPSVLAASATTISLSASLGIARPIPCELQEQDHWVTFSMTSRSAALPMGYWQVRRFFVAVPRVDHLTNANRNRELGAIRKPHQDLFPEFGIFDDEQFGNELADHLGKIKFCFRHCPRTVA